MWLTRLFVARPTRVTVFLALVILAGCISATSLVQQQFPSTATPSVQVLISYPGASTTQMRDAIVRPLEDQIAGAPYLDHIDTTIESGSVSIAAAFALTSTDTENIANVEKALQAAQSNRYKIKDKIRVEWHGQLYPAEVVGIVGGTATTTGATNFMRLHLIGDRLE